jgi:hypothetical protein
LQNAIHFSIFTVFRKKVEILMEMPFSTRDPYCGAQVQSMTLLSIFATALHNNGPIDSKPSANVLDKVVFFLRTFIYEELGSKTL